MGARFLSDRQIARKIGCSPKWLSAIRCADWTYPDAQRTRDVGEEGWERVYRFSEVEDYLIRHGKLDPETGKAIIKRRK